MANSTTTPPDTKEIFMKCGACSHTFFHVLDREFGHVKETEERASDPLAGGLMRGEQCGMLWGSTLAAGAQAFRMYNDQGQAIAAAITTSQLLVESFSSRAKSVNCREIIGVDFTNKFGVTILMLKILLQGGINNSTCFNLAEKWTPEAIRSAKEGLARAQTDLVQTPASCACEVARKMGASDEEMLTLAGLAGGMGLSGNACGALGAAIWLKTLARYRNNPAKPPDPFKNPDVTNTINTFLEATGSEILCHKITGQRFKTISEHSEFIKNGGCARLIDALATEAI